MPDSRLSGFYRLDIGERLDALLEKGWISARDAASLRAGHHVLAPQAADQIIENVIASFGLPLAIAPNFLVNGKDYVVPLVVEEPSVVAALSGAARLARNSGGFRAWCDEFLLTGQVHLSGIADPEAAVASISASASELLSLANGVHPRLVERGGGVREVNAHLNTCPDGDVIVAVHLQVDTCDAMGANLVNTLCEAIAPELQKLCGGKVAMSILSNLADRALLHAQMRIRLPDLSSSPEEAAEIRDAIIRADQIAHADPYRAATHNKGIMNGIDPLAIATGNDWRAIEAGAHAFAASSGQYRPLTVWSADEDGKLLGELTIPLKPGIVGGTLKSNPAAAIGLRISAVESALELATLMAAVGLAQNFAAIRALATTGIQKGHMRLHARSVAAAAGIPARWSDAVIAEMLASGDVSSRNARERLAEIRVALPGQRRDWSTAAGKVILFGEHAVVYGQHALALPIPDAVSVRAHIGQGDATLPEGFDAGVALIARELDVPVEGIELEVVSRLPRAMGLGSSAALAVAITRAIAAAHDIEIDDAGVNRIAFECERLAHGTPSGIDNTIASYAMPMLFQSDGELHTDLLELREPPPLVIGLSHTRGLTVEQVAGVRERFLEHRSNYQSLFDEIDTISQSGARALQSADYKTLGALMDINQGLLNALGVSTPELESMLAIARAHGALGAKLTGGGGGGSIVAVCPGCEADVRAALADAGYESMTLETTGA